MGRKPGGRALLEKKEACWEGRRGKESYGKREDNGKGWDDVGIGDWNDESKM